MVNTLHFAFPYLVKQASGLWGCAVSRLYGHLLWSFYNISSEVAERSCRERDTIDSACSYGLETQFLTAQAKRQINLQANPNQMGPLSTVEQITNGRIVRTSRKAPPTNA